jgi:hypothetical protein
MNGSVTTLALALAVAPLALPASATSPKPSGNVQDMGAGFVTSVTEHEDAETRVHVLRTPDGCTTIVQKRNAAGGWSVLARTRSVQAGGRCE